MDTLTQQDLAIKAPSIFTSTPREDRSKRYSHISTANVVQELMKEGFQPTRASQVRSRIQSRRPFAKHFITFTHPDYKMVGEVQPELLLRNSHDGTSAFMLDFGLFRYICENGLVVPDKTMVSVRVQHIGSDLTGRVIEGSYKVLDQSDAVIEQVDNMNHTLLSDADIHDFAVSAASLRWSNEDYMPISPIDLVQSRRSEDNHKTLWHIYNRVQENLIKGGLRGRSRPSKKYPHGRLVRTRPLSSINRSIDINKNLFGLALSYIN